MAGNKLSIAFRPESKYATEINRDNWWEILSRPDVKVGISDPRFDAVGYRLMMVFALAQQESGNPTLFNDFIKGQFEVPVRLIDLGDQQIIRIPELLETKPQKPHHDARVERGIDCPAAIWRGRLCL